MRRLDHCNIVSLLYFFYTSGEKKVKSTQTKFSNSYIDARTVLVQSRQIVVPVRL
jgi:hypothetical protein